MEGSSFTDALASIGRAFTSPAKLAFIGYVILSYAGKIQTSVTQFLIVAGVFFLLQILHDDCLRIALNNWGDRLGRWGRQMPTVRFHITETLSVMLVGSLLLFSGHLNGQSQDDEATNGRKINFHVTAVSQKDDASACDTGECSAIKFTIEGYTDGQHTGTRIAYVLTCDEYWANKPNPHITIVCARVHADNDYVVRLYADSIGFWTDDKYTQPPARGLYSIESEKEVSKQAKVGR